MPMERAICGTSSVLGQSGPVMVAFMLDEDLRLVLEPAKGGAVDDAVPIPLEGTARA